MAGLNGNGVLQVGMEPGSLVPLPPRADIQFSEPADPGDYGAHVKNNVAPSRAASASLRISGDLGRRYLFLDLAWSSFTAGSPLKF